MKAYLNLESRVKEILLKLFSILFILSSLYIVLTAVFNSYDMFYNMKPFAILIGSGLLLITLYYIDRKLKKLEDKKLKQIIVFSRILMILLQIGFTIIFLVHPTWDYGAVISTAQDFAKGNENLSEYFYTFYPNNIGITLFFGYLFKIVNKFFTDKELYAAIAVNIVIINLSIFLLGRFIKKIYGYGKSALFSIFILLVTPFYTYAQIVYTDTMTMVFPIAMFILLYDYISNEKNNKFTNIILVGALGAIGTILKTNIIISVIAIIIYLIFTQQIKKALKNCILLILPFVIIMGMFQSFAENFIPIPYKEAGLPFTHWIMMGLNEEEGGYYEPDVQFSSAIRLQQGKEAVSDANKKVIVERLRNYGLVGIIKHINTKASLTWGEGTYFAPNKMQRDPFKDSNIKRYVIGDKNKVFVYISQFSHVIILLGIFIGAISCFKKTTDFMQLINICIFGVFLFLIMWETRSRYLVCYLPVLILATFNGLNIMFDKLDNLRVKSIYRRK